MQKHYLGKAVASASRWLTLVALPLAGHAQTALRLDGVNDYVTMGAAPGLNTSTFTLECWVKPAGTAGGILGGVTATTGSGGVNAIPLVTKGRGESDTPANINCGYFLGLTPAGNVAADFEATGGGLNYPITGTGTVVFNAWNHVAVTYGAGVWTTYINGVLDRTLTLTGTPVPEPNTIQRFALGSALNSTGATEGFLQGDLDNVRVWNVVRTAAQIQASFAQVISVATPGLIGNYRLDEGTGLTTVNAGSATGTTPGTLTNGPLWVMGSPNTIPHAPVIGLLSPAANFLNADTTGTLLSAAVTDTDGDAMTVEFWGRKKAPSRPNYTIVPLPDMQYYHGAVNGGTPAMSVSQASWLRSNVGPRNIVYTVQLGDCVERGDNGGNDIEWQRANASFSLLEPALPGLPNGLPYGICVGNHDQSPNGSPTGTTTFYNQYFGRQRFQGRGYYGGSYRPDDNDNHFQLFSGGAGLDFIAINLEYDVTQNTGVLAWADSLLKAYPARRGIISSHYILTNSTTWGAQGQRIYTGLKNNPNLDLMLCGHVTAAEGRRSDTFNGHTVHTLLSDYQFRTGGGNGYLRIMEFVPDQNIINVKTYSPFLNQYETDADSEFTLAYDQNPTPWVLLATRPNVASGSTASYNWTPLQGATDYEWYVTVRDASSSVQSPTHSLSTTGRQVLATASARAAAPLHVVPNPTDGLRFAVQGLDQLGGAVELRLTDVLGREVGHTALAHPLARHELSELTRGLPAGQYILRAVGPKGATSVRFQLTR
jgi:hypothetical protein